MQKHPVSDQLQIFVINRKKDAERRANMSKRLGDLGLEFEFFEAVDGHQIDAYSVPEYDGEKRRLYFGRDLSIGEIGCILSHRAIYRKITDERIPLTLILEDDTHFKEDFPDVLEALVRESKKWDMIRFLDRKKIFKAPYRILKQLTETYSLARVRGIPGGAYAYLVTSRAAEVLYNNTKRNSVQIDIIHGRHWETGLDVLVTKPSPVSPDLEIPSTIGETRFDKEITVSGFKRLIFPVFRFCFKVNSSIRSRWYFAKKKQADRRNWRI
ncbi:hypothetical protein GUA87_15450 [Sneathiella sp. P13V-1]|uniref:glycosyltransferase family 25 protein n=1 Tax=Sneathiella sp. P13V-1 TaxID=2697366 RepID=UPI00187BB008|nr:glycosyltransferase family 25 protein [Sneathiella sp. P13V-1]MBE7638252.1 hypothetical protein [Sneathiella sp. P13V-1]